jgi:hypothetical protein
MSITIDLDPSLEKELTSFVEREDINISLLFQQFLEELMREKHQPTAWELGKDGFGADQTHEGDIAKNTKFLLKARFKNDS